MKILILCSLLLSATAYHGTLHSEYTTVEFVPNVKKIDQAPRGGKPKPNDIGLNLYTTTISPVFTPSQDEFGQKEQTSDIDDETLELIFGPSNVKEVDSTTQFTETDLINPIGTESTLHNLIETSGVGRIDVRSTVNIPEVQNVPKQYGQGFKPSSQRQGPRKNQFSTSSHGFEDNSNIGYNSVGFSSTPNIINTGGKTDEVSTTPTSIGGTKGSQPGANSDYPILRPKSQAVQPKVTPTYPIFRPVNQDESRQPSLYPRYPNTKPGNQGGSNQPGVIPTYTINRPGNQGGSNQHGVIPTYTINRPGNQGGRNQPGVNPTHSTARPGNKGGSTQAGGSPTYPNFQSRNQGSAYWPGIQIGVNPTAVPVGQVGIPGYWPYVQYGDYYSPYYMPGYGYENWFGNGQEYFYSYPSYGAQYGWPYTQDAVGYGNGWFGFNGHEPRNYNHNHGSLNGPEHQYSHHHHHQQPGVQHGYHFNYNYNRGY